MSNTAIRPVVSPATRTRFSLSVDRATTCSSGFWVRGKDPRGSSGPKRSQNLACPWSLVTKVPQPRSLVLARLRRKSIWSTGARLNCILHRHSDRRERGMALSSHSCYLHDVSATKQHTHIHAYIATYVHTSYIHKCTHTHIRTDVASRGYLHNCHEWGRKSANSKW